MSAFEQHYSPEKLGKLWDMSDDTVRHLFQHEPGVLRIDHPETMHKRRYTSMKIPGSVAARVHDRLSSKGKGR